MVTDDTKQTFLTKNYSGEKPSNSFAHFRFRMMRYVDGPTAHEPRLEILFINYFLVNLGIIVLNLSYYVGNFMIRLFYRILDRVRRKLPRLYKAPLIYH